MKSPPHSDFKDQLDKIDITVISSRYELTMRGHPFFSLPRVEEGGGGCVCPTFTSCPGVGRYELTMRGHPFFSLPRVEKEGGGGGVCPTFTSCPGVGRYELTMRGHPFFSLPRVEKEGGGGVCVPNIHIMPWGRSL